MSKKTKVGAKPKVRNAVLLALRNGQASVADLSQASGCEKVKAAYMGALVEQGFIVVAEHVRSGRRGRPACIYKLTSKGRMTALNLSKVAA